MRALLRIIATPPDDWSHDCYDRRSGGRIGTAAETDISKMFQIYKLQNYIITLDGADCICLYFWD